MGIRVAGGFVVKTSVLLSADFLTMLGSRHVFEMYGSTGKTARNIATGR